MPTPKMNLYDHDDGFPRFTLAEANGKLREVISATRVAVELLNAVNKTHELTKGEDPEKAKSDLAAATEKILSDWSLAITKLGAYPKGYFTVDFKSPVPNTLLCWTFGEEEIKHTHKTTETFKDRVKIEDVTNVGFEGTLN